MVCFNENPFLPSSPKIIHLASKTKKYAHISKSVLVGQKKNGPFLFYNDSSAFTTENTKVTKEKLNFSLVN